MGGTCVVSVVMADTNDGPTSAEPTTEGSPLAKAIAGLGMRSIGPAFMGGRISDIAVHPHRKATWYIAAGSGGVWKTVNAGITWHAIFEDQPSFSIGCVTLDPNEPDVVWVGTGEAVSGRHVAWGDGVYRSRNGGVSWEHMGLEASEHIADILVDPRDSNTVYVAAEGPLWSTGGERGVYKTTDGGETWVAALSIDADTGVTSLTFAPDNPEVLYAAAYQRRRHVATFVGGGASSGIYKSSDGGGTWRKTTEGLPKGDMGKIGLATTAANPELVYATVEANKTDRGFYRSTDRGESWEKRNEYISGGTGPHYYQEIFASPIDADRVYQVDVFLHATTDGGKTFARRETGKTKHSDNHSVWIDPDDPDHLLVGSDAGLYETFDDGDSYRHFENMPLSQFYRVALDNSEPFYSILAGAQDLGTLLGPSRTTNIDGVRNKDWNVPLGADGYHVAFDPSDPNICYLEWQVGNVMRYDRRTHELQDIQPQPAADEPPERWNWDCPIVVSPHDSNRIYLASQRVWQSDDRGDSWRPISGDLTTARNRYEMPTFGSVPSVDALHDHMAMSQFSTITYLSESPVLAGLLYVGTDDGLVHSSEDGGETWRLAASPAGLPTESFINNVEASQHNSDEVFLAADDHKNGDFTPHLYKSSDRGRSWQSIRGDLPERLIIWCVEQDHVNPDLLFVGTEFGIYTTVDAGTSWHKLSKDVPTISFRDIKLHRRDSDLVAASFGRGIYVLDDYSPLRSLSSDMLQDEAILFGVRDAWWYVPRLSAQAVGQPTLGSTAYRTPNPGFGATFTYYLASDLVGPAKQREAIEKPHRESGDDVAFPGVEALWAEHLSIEPVVVLVIRDDSGTAIRTVAGEATAGVHRVAWDLRYVAPDPVKLDQPEFRAPWETDPQGPLVEPGTYSAELVEVSSTGVRVLTEPQTFALKPTPAISALGDHAGVLGFSTQTADLLRRVAGAKRDVDTAITQVPVIRATVQQTPTAHELLPRLDAVHRSFTEIRRELVEDPINERLSEPHGPSISQLVERVAQHDWSTTQAPTQTQVTSVTRASDAFAPLRSRLIDTLSELAELRHELDAAGGSWTP